jgi:hypothetical protein
VLPGHDARGGTVRWDAAAWKRMGNLSIQLQGSQTTLLGQGSPQNRLPIDTLGPQADSSALHQVRVLTDVATWLHWARGRVQLSAATGLRFGSTQAAASPPPQTGTDRSSRTDAQSQTWGWWELQGTWWLAGRVGIAGGIGHHPPEPGLLATGGSFFRLGFRVALDRRGPDLPAPAGGKSNSLRVRRDGAQVELELLAPGVERVELMGDFTDWLPVSLERASSGRWRVRMPVSPGLHYLNVRYDGGPWVAPPSTRVILDEYHRETGVVVVG